MDDPPLHFLARATDATVLLARASQNGTSIATANSASTATFITALVFNAIVFGAELAVFTLIRPYFRAIYEPLTYVPEPAKRAKPLTRNFLAWPWAVFRADYRAIIRSNGLDAYFFVRFLRVMAFTFLPIWLISWAVLMPITSVHTRVAGLSGLDRFTYGNVAKDKQKRYAAHVLLVYGFTFWIFYKIKGEMRHFVITRQQHLIERTHSKSVQATTILITGIPAKYLSRAALYKMFNELPGGVKQIWINRNLKELPDIYDRRMAACAKLESAETALLQTAAKLRLKANKKAGGGDSSTAPAHTDSNKGNTDVEADLAHAEVTVPDSERPTHRLGFLPFTGEKVDTIRWARKEISVCTALLEEGRARIGEADEDHAGGDDGDDAILADAPLDEDGNPRLRTSEEPRIVDELRSPVKAGKAAVGTIGHAGRAAVGGVAKGAGAIKERVVGSDSGGVYPPMNSAFVSFHRQIAAHLAVQVLTHHEPYRMASKYIEVAPSDVIWANLNLNPYEQKIRLVISYAATAGLILLWAFPVAFVGVISNIHTVCTTASWLAWICDLPKVVVGIISGILPPVLLAVLMMLLPIVLRLLARFEGIPKYTGLELSLMTRFFLFQVLHSFLIVTLSSGIIASLNEILKSPTSVPSILATNLPQASNFFLTYIILQGLSGVAGGFLQIVRLIIYYVKLILLGSTPRSVWGIKYVPPSVAWGTTFPGITLLVVITLGYSIISPIINGLACATFFGFYMLYKYLFLYSYQQPTTSDTGGMFYPKAIQHVFVGLYVQQVCLAGLFFLAQDANKHPSAVPEGALMIILIVLTTGFQLILNNSYDPLLTALPLSLQHRTYTPVVIPANGSEGDVSPAPAAERRSEEQEEGEDAHLKPASLADQRAEADEESYGFAHPAASRPQRIIWIPRDTLGLADMEARDCEEEGVRVSMRHAEMNEKGKVDVDGGPPDLIQA